MTAGPVVQAVRRDLRRLTLSDRRCALALSALTLAGLLDSVAVEVPESGLSIDKRLTSAAQAARELRGTMADLLKNAPQARSGIDDLRARRAARAAAG